MWSSVVEFILVVRRLGEGMDCVVFRLECCSVFMMLWDFVSSLSWRAYIWVFCMDFEFHVV